MSVENESLLISLKNAVFGNGRKGLTDRVTVIETKIDTGSKLLWGILLLSIPNVISVIKLFVEK